MRWGLHLNVLVSLGLTVLTRPVFFNVLSNVSVSDLCA